MKSIVTGAASGIGQAVAQLLAQPTAGEPAQLVLVDRNGDGLEAIAANLRQMGAQIVTEVVDLADVTSAERVVERARTEFGGLDALVSNAGLLKPGPLAELSLQDYEYVFAVNTRATWLLCKAAYPMLRTSHGSVVATASIASENPTPPQGAYSASKAALVMLIEQMAVEWGPDGIRCNCVSPGSTLTGITERVYANPTERNRRTNSIALRRLGMPNDIANAIVFLLSPQSSFITGVNLVVDGGANCMLMQLSGAGTGSLKPD
ncbi:MAG: SDR family oxidoreductase [Gallionella sp.]|nr:SDR family oxidoreductase [Gallionella sp.]